MYESSSEIYVLPLSPAKQALFIACERDRGVMDCHLKASRVRKRCNSIAMESTSAVEAEQRAPLENSLLEYAC